MTQETPHLIQKIERGLELPDGFLVRLLNERDDWSFIIKTHALVESAVNHALVAKLRKREVSNVIARLALSNESTGKLALVKSLGLLEREHRTFIRWLSELRNHIVHDVRNVDFQLNAYADELDSREPRLFRKRFGAIFKQTSSESLVAPGVPERRTIIWASASAIAGLCYVVKSREDLDIKIEQYQIESFENFIKL